MKAENFCYWLAGMLEDQEYLDSEQTDKIRAELQKVFSEEVGNLRNNKEYLKNLEIVCSNSGQQDLAKIVKASSSYSSLPITNSSMLISKIYS